MVLRSYGLTTRHLLCKNPNGKWGGGKEAGEDVIRYQYPPDTATAPTFPPKAGFIFCIVTSA